MNIFQKMANFILFLFEANFRIFTRITQKHKVRAVFWSKNDFFLRILIRI